MRIEEAGFGLGGAIAKLKDIAERETSMRTGVSMKKKRPE